MRSEEIKRGISLSFSVDFHVYSRHSRSRLRQDLNLVKYRETERHKKLGKKPPPIYGEFCQVEVVYEARLLGSYE